MNTTKFVYASITLYGYNKIYPPVSRHLGCLQFWAITNTDFKNIHVKIIAWMQFSYFFFFPFLIVICINLNGKAGMYDRYMFNFF